MNERSEKHRETEKDQPKTHLESREAERKITRKNKWNAADGFNVADLGSSTWLDATEIYWSANCFFFSPLYLLISICLWFACVLQNAWFMWNRSEKLWPFRSIKNALRGWKWPFGLFFLLRFHSHLYFSSLIRSSSSRAAVFFDTSPRSWSCSTFVRLTILHSVPLPHPSPPLHWHHCWRSVIRRSNNWQLLCYSVELVSLLCSAPTVHDGVFAARWHHLSGHSACL